MVEETVAGVRVVKGFGAEPVQAGAAPRRGRRRLRRVDGGRPGAGRPSCPALELLPNIGLIARARLRRPPGAQRQPVASAQLVAFNVYVVMLIWPLRMLGMIIAQAPAGGRRRPSGCTRSSATEPAIVDPPHAVTLPEPRGRPAAAGEVRFEGVALRATPPDRPARARRLRPRRCRRASPSRSSAPPAAARPPSPG